MYTTYSRLLYGVLHEEEMLRLQRSDWVCIMVTVMNHDKEVERDFRGEWVELFFRRREGSFCPILWWCCDSSLLCMTAFFLAKSCIEESERRKKKMMISNQFWSDKFSGHALNFGDFRDFWLGSISAFHVIRMIYMYYRHFVGFFLVVQS